ncbi:hypothetical protein BU24DRAFT_133352 [Aaosphaeria arxii CBS 175.79]|uniref:Uncharacterized protein n=1 Tax=Aaosphaeria arxii CBS 175.79 TaxID=1450172 RepID=A0A6A5Y489_9PLEO|nr:uncharacterized protein BU24DRAFT_133352 [Aaosphaeria arxii CBS 175.79]KAF2020089.1 hypothetical protein BU24DRAFT_133352 [Aaosphaeria arxii CBS 175.79]
MCNYVCFCSGSLYCNITAGVDETPFGLDTWPSDRPSSRHFSSKSSNSLAKMAGGIKLPLSSSQLLLSFLRWWLRHRSLHPALMFRGANRNPQYLRWHYDGMADLCRLSRVACLFGARQLGLVNRVGDHAQGERRRDSAPQGGSSAKSILAKIRETPQDSLRSLREREHTSSLCRMVAWSWLGMPTSRIQGI